MSSEALLSNFIPLAGSGLLGYAIFTLKKILKWMIIIVGFLAGWDVLCWFSTAAKVCICERG
jgi:hypothetical protein